MESVVVADWKDGWPDCLNASSRSKSPMDLTCHAREKASKKAKRSFENNL